MTDPVRMIVDPEDLALLLRATVQWARVLFLADCDEQAAGLLMQAGRIARDAAKDMENKSMMIDEMTRWMDDLDGDAA